MKEIKVEINYSPYYYSDIHIVKITEDRECSLELNVKKCETLCLNVFV